MRNKDFARRLSWRAESDGRNGASPSLRSSASSPGTLFCLPRAASKLAHKTNTGSDSRCCLSSASQRVPATRSQSSAPGTARPLGERGICRPDGARLATAADRERIEGAMHQSCSLKRIQPSSVPQVYCIAPERRFRSVVNLRPEGSLPRDN